MTEQQLFDLLEAWRARGFEVQLRGDKTGWCIELSTSYRRSEEPMPDTGDLRFKSPTLERPEVAIAAVLKAVQP